MLSAFCLMLFAGCSTVVRTRFQFASPATNQDKAEVEGIVDTVACRFNFVDQTAKRRSEVPAFADQWIRAYGKRRDLHHGELDLWAITNDDSLSVILQEWRGKRSVLFSGAESALTDQFSRTKLRMRAETEVLHVSM
jgi:hypothetical protein